MGLKYGLFMNGLRVILFVGILVAVPLIGGASMMHAPPGTDEWYEAVDDEVHEPLIGGATMNEITITNQAAYGTVSYIGMHAPPGTDEWYEAVDDGVHGPHKIDIKKI